MRACLFQAIYPGFSMNSRVADIGAFAIDRGKRGSGRRIALILLVIALLMLYVGGKVQLYRLGYQIEALEREKVELERANRSLRIEASSLSSPARIEELAIKRLGMVRPAKENIVVIKRKLKPKQ